MTSTVASPDFTAEDTALLQALELYEQQLCPGCRQPVWLAWHPELDGWWGTEDHVCYACSAKETAAHGPEAKPVTFSFTVNQYPRDLAALPPLSLGGSDDD